MAGVKIIECTILMIITIFAVEVCSQQYDLVKVRSLFIDNLIDTIGSDAGISLEDIEEYFSRHNLKWVEQSTVDECFNDNPGNFSVDAKCLLEKVSKFVLFFCRESMLKINVDLILSTTLSSLHFITLLTSFRSLVIYVTVQTGVL